MPLTSRARQGVLVLVSLFSLLTILAVYRPPSSDAIRSFSPSQLLYSSSSSSSYSAQVVEDASVKPLELLSQLYEDERVALLADFDQFSTEALVRTAPDALNPDFNAYITRLEGFTNKYFRHSKYHGAITNSLQRMVNGHPPVGEQDFRKDIFTFDKNGRFGVPEEFQWWDRRLSSKGWSIEVGDDEKMEEWYEESVGLDMEEKEMTEEEVMESGKQVWDEMWHGLGRPVLKSDLLRYLMMLVQGGLYTDSDTSILSDPDLWGTHAHDLTPRGLAALQRAMRHLDPSHPSYQHLPEPYPELVEIDEDESADRAEQPMSEDLDFASNLIKDTSRGINNQRVSLVVAVEYDVHHERQDPRFGYTRDLQIVQWTFMAKPFHPVFLDVLETATTEIMTRREHGEGHDSWHSVLDGTGPGPFTDAVLRYILVQYGVTPHELIGMEDGALIGDILVLPLHAFGSFLGGEQDWNAHDPSTRCTAHGFRGRWKGDISFERRSRVPPQLGQ